jgi:hypothetical protein
MRPSRNSSSTSGGKRRGLSAAMGPGKVATRVPGKSMVSYGRATRLTCGMHRHGADPVGVDALEGVRQRPPVAAAARADNNG